ncbi:MAG TPA: helix-turn-helix domain-containing protein [Acidimicrobiales bacterium]|nr:helix-turn-helix domain-containing protein [Acidimicrobiales bacterium]
MAIAPDLETLLQHMGTPAPTVVAGDRGLHRRVLAVEVLAPQHGAPPAGREALLIADRAAVGERGDGLVREAHEAGAAGIVIVQLRELPVDLLRAANELALPVAVSHAVDAPHDVAVAALNALVAHQREGSDALEDRFASITLEELISSDPHRTQEAIERASNLGWDLHRPRAVLLASIDPPVDPDVARRVLGTIAAAARATLGEDAIVWMRATSIAALIAADDGTAAKRRGLADALREELDERVRNVTLSIGVGRCVDDPTELATSFVDANRAVDVGRWAKGRHVTELYDELGLERLFASVPQQDLHDFVLNAIGPLLDHDRGHRTDLVETLSTWLETRNMAEAARQLFVHYNTFKNRLERIEAILGPVLADPGRLLECEVAIYVSRHYDGPWRTGAEIA